MSLSVIFRKNGYFSSKIECIVVGCDAMEGREVVEGGACWGRNWNVVIWAEGPFDEVEMAVSGTCPGSGELRLELWVDPVEAGKAWG